MHLQKPDLGGNLEIPFGSTSLLSAFSSPPMSDPGGGGGGVQLLSWIWFFVTLWTSAHQASLSFTTSRNLLRLSPLSWWCYLTISSSATPFSCPQSFPASESCPVSQPFTSGGQSIRALASVLPMNMQGWFPLGLAGLISLLFKGLSRVFSSTTVQKHQFFGVQPSLWSNSHINTWLLGKPELWLYEPLSAKRGLCYARCPNPRAGREEASKTMQLAKKGKFITDSSQGLLPQPSQWCRVRKPWAEAVTQIYKVCISG